MRSWRMVWMVVMIALLIDLYVFQAVKAITQASFPYWQAIIYNCYWGCSILALTILCLLRFIRQYFARLQGYVFFGILSLYFAKLLICVFLLIDDVRRLIQWVVSRLSIHPAPGAGISAEGISRSVFLSWVGIGVGVGLYAAFLYGFSNKYNYRVRKLTLAFKNLPASFKGLKIVQLSDIHSGSFNDKVAVGRGVDKVLAEKPDLILFTGDLVNDMAVEMMDYKDIFARLKAPMGVFSTLGNHDYGDYVGWETPEQKKNNLNHLMELQREMGWRLLMNEHVVLERGGEKIALIGIENWSAKARFPKYGKMNEAYPGSEK